MRAVRFFARSAVLGAFASVLSACVSVLPEADPAAPRFGVNDVDDLPAGDAVEWSLSVDDPIATRGVDTVKIARVEDGSRYVYYAGGEWVDRAPRLLQTALVRSFQNTNRIIGVGAAASQPIADYVLKLDIRSFETQKTKSGMVAVADVYVRLVDVRGRNYAAQRFVQKLDIRRDTAGDAARTLNRASMQLIPEIVEWVLIEGERVNDTEGSQAGLGDFRKRAL